ncbi:hypothetical protein H4S00_000655 [Coemansia sp. D1744]|nr:hypothetical protein H4S00_000655 [Coemansia sp. D1744]
MESGKRKQTQGQTEKPANKGRNLPHSHDAEDDVDLGSMSPQSRRRHQSRMSSARLRERQRLRISGAEEDVAQLESYVRSLQNSIDFHYQSQVQDDRTGGECSSDTDLALARIPEVRLPMGAEDIGDIRDTVNDFMRHKYDGMTTGNTSSTAGNTSSIAATYADTQLLSSENNSDVGRQIHGSIISMNNTVDHLQGCVERIDSLKEMISKRVHILERNSRPGPLLSQTLLGGDTLRNTTENSSGSAQGSTTGSLPVADKKLNDRRKSSEQPSRFSISFLMGEDGI